MLNFNLNLNFKKAFSILVVLNTVACAMPKPGEKELTKTNPAAAAPAGAELLLENSEAPKAMGEELDADIAIPIAKKFQFKVCLKSNQENTTIAPQDLVVLTLGTESKNLIADENACVQWEESIDTAAKTEGNNLEIQRSLEMKPKFSNTLLVNFNLDAGNLETTENSAPSFELGFERLRLKVTKKSDKKYALDLQGSPTINGESLKYGKLKGLISLQSHSADKKMRLGKSVQIQGLIKRGNMNLETQENILTCEDGLAYVKIEFSAISRRHVISPLSEIHALKDCDQLEGVYELDKPLMDKI